MFKILVVDDDHDLRVSVADALSEARYQVDHASNGEEAVNRVRAHHYDLVLMDVHMPKLSGIEALKEIKAHDSSIIVIMLTAFSNVRDAIEATKQGAYNYLEKPIKTENLVYLVEKSIKAKNMVSDVTLRAPVFRLQNGGEFVGQSTEMKKVFSIIEKLAMVDTAVLIRGESGTGKELVAQALHFNSPRKENRFVTINCSAIPESLIESEFFGHEKGAFTGADSRKIGKFQYADGGTLFLDEIGDISPSMQVKLLRALQEKRFTPVGSNREIDVNIRVVAATNRNLEEMIKRGEFREDLFYRLNVLPIQLPPLRERKNDIQSLAYHFINKFNLQHQKKIKGLSPEALDILLKHDWPGNIRELENVIEHAFVLESSEIITPQSFPESIKHTSSQVTGLTITKGEILKTAEISKGDSKNDQKSGQKNDDPKNDEMILSVKPITLTNPETGYSVTTHKLDFQASKEAFEKQFLVNALKAFKGRINQTALHANIPKKTLLRKLEKYGINAKDYSSN